MADFTVAPSALTSFARQLSGAATGSGTEGLDNEFLTAAQDYTHEWVKLKGGSGGMIFSPIVGAMDRLDGQICTNYTDIGELLISSADGLTASATTYGKQDHATAVHLDSIYKPTGVTPLSDNVDTSSPAVDPVSVLTEPSEDGAVPDFAQQILDAVGYFSETELVLKILALFHLNVEDWVKQRFFGDFKRVAQCRNALINLSKFDDAAATNLADGTNGMMKSWRGSAASAAQSYFDHFANGLGNHSSQLSGLAQKLEALVVAIQQAGSTVIGGITLALDAAAEGAAALAAAGCLEEVPVVDVLMDIIGAWRVTKIITRVHELSAIWGYVWGGLQTLMSGVLLAIGALQTYSAAAKLPSVGYANAAEGQRPAEDTATNDTRRPQ